MSDDTPRSTVRAIETRYAGHRFRSRLEARWAVFFDALRIEWEYEPQGFVIGDMGGEERNYLPDFYLPQLGTWVEVKGDPREVDWGLMAAAVDGVGAHLPGVTNPPDDSVRGLLVLGNIPPDGKRWGHWLVRHYKGVIADTAEFGLWSNKTGTLRQAPIYGDYCTCSTFFHETSWGPTQDHHGTALGNQSVARRGVIDCVYLDYQVDIVSKAYAAARSARFEHGEAPRITAPRIHPPRLDPPRA
jgi:hypothetical protein